MPAGSARIESARGGPDDAHAGGILDFLTQEAGLNEEAARQWLSELVCVAAEDRRVVGVSSAHPVSLPQVGGRHFWLYRSVLAPDSGERRDALFNSSFEVLGEEFDKSEGTRLGLCVLVDDVAERPPNAIWTETELMFAGYLDDDRQIRLRYFWGAAIAPGLPTSPSLDETRRQSYPLEDRYRIVPLGETGSVSAHDVLEFWAREGAIPDADEDEGKRGGGASPEGDEDEAKRGGGGVRLVAIEAIEADEAIVGVSSLYLQRNSQLRM